MLELVTETNGLFQVPVDNSENDLDLRDESSVAIIFSNYISNGHAYEAVASFNSFHARWTNEKIMVTIRDRFMLWL